jgi:hypothetical protein
MEEETGLKVTVQRLIVDDVRGTPQHYFLVKAVGGEFGRGQGEEYTTQLPPEEGTYQPVWMPVVDLSRNPVLPPVIANLVLRSHPHHWPESPLRFTEAPISL